MQSIFITRGRSSSCCTQTFSSGGMIQVPISRDEQSIMTAQTYSMLPGVRTQWHTSRSLAPRPCRERLCKTYKSTHQQNYPITRKSPHLRSSTSYKTCAPLPYFLHLHCPCSSALNAQTAPPLPCVASLLRM